MTNRQCEIAAESYSACLLAQAGFDVLVQYGANQPHYDLVADKCESEKGKGIFLPISVKGGQEGGWPLAGNYKKGRSYHAAIDAWFNRQRKDIIFLFVQFWGVDIGDAPRAYVATPKEVATHLKKQNNRKGHGALREDYHLRHPRSKCKDKIPSAWKFTQERIDVLWQERKKRKNP